MAAFLSFEGLKAAIIANTRQYGVCEGLWPVMRSTDYQTLIDAGINQLVYAYRSGIITDALLAEVDETLLNENGIYTTNASIINPGVEVFVLGSSVLTITIDNGNMHNVNIMGAGRATITISGNSFCTVTTWQNASANIIVNDTSTVHVTVRQKSAATITQRGTSLTDVATLDETLLSLNTAAGTYALVQGYGHSRITTAGSGTIDQRLDELSSNPIFNPIPAS